MATLVLDPDAPTLSASVTDNAGNAVEISGDGPWDLPDYQITALRACYVPRESDGALIPAFD